MMKNLPSISRVGARQARTIIRRVLPGVLFSFSSGAASVAGTSDHLKLMKCRHSILSMPEIVSFRGATHSAIPMAASPSFNLF